MSDGTPAPLARIATAVRPDARASLGARLGRGFALVVGALLLAVVASGVAFTMSGNAWSDAAEWANATEGAGKRVESALRERSAQAAYSATGETRFRDEFDAADKIGEEADALLESVHDPIFSELVATAEANDDKHDASLDVLFGLIEAKAPQPEISAALQKADALVMIEYDASVKIQGRIDELRQDAVDSANGREQLALLLAIGFGLLAVGLAVVIARRIIAAVRTPIGRLVESCERAGSGDLTVRFAEDGPSEIGAVGAALNRAFASIGDVVRDLRRTSTELAGSSKQLASSADETGRAVDEVTRAITEAAHGAERQAALAATVKRAYDASRSAVDDGVGASSGIDAAMEGVREASQEVMAVIGDLDQRSDRIGGIIQTITDIAEQTNLLALNAAIEAARAGDLGRGFAVVADEVRKLAEESQTAASSIAGIVEEIRDATRRAVEASSAGAGRVDAGTEVLGATRAAFARIADETAAVEVALGEVSEVAAGQSAVNQEVSAIAEETSASTRIVADEAQRIADAATALDRSLSRFTV